MNKDLKEMGNEIKELLEKYPHRQKEILFYIFGEDTIREIIKKPTYEELEQKVNQLETNRDEAIEYIKNNTKYFDSEYVSIYGELCDIAGAGDTRTHCVIGDKQLLEILERGKE